MREVAISVLASTMHEDIKVVVFGMELRNLITQDKFYRQPQQIRLNLLQHFVTDVCQSYNIPVLHVTNVHIIANLSLLKGTAWANAVYAIASPSLYVKNILALQNSQFVSGYVKLPCSDVLVMPTIEVLLVAWQQAIAEFFNNYSDVRVVEYIVNTINNSSQLVEAYNAAVPYEWNRIQLADTPVAYQSIEE